MTNTLDKRMCGCTEACKMVGFFNRNNSVHDFFECLMKSSKSVIGIASTSQVILCSSRPIALLPWALILHFPNVGASSIHTARFLLKQGHVTVFEQRVKIHSAFCYKYFWMLNQCFPAVPIMGSLLLLHHGRPSPSPFSASALGWLCAQIPAPLSHCTGWTT